MRSFYRLAPTSGKNGKSRTVSFPDDTMRFAYDRDGLVVAASNRIGIVSNAYNEVSWLTRTKGVDGSEVAYTYYPAGQVEAMTTVAGTTVYDLNEADKLAGIASGSESFVYSYNPWNGLVAAVTNANGIAANYTYDIMNRITGIA